MYQKVEKALLDLGIAFLTNEPMQMHTTFQIGGPSDIYVTPTDEKEIQAILKIATEENIPVTVLGKGSNVLVSDKGIRGIVLDLVEHFNKISVESEFIVAQSGATLAKIASVASSNSLTGFEFASGIPGTFGGAIMMNAGAYDAEMKDVVVETNFLENGEAKVLKGEEHLFSYRNSYFKQNNGCIIVSSKIHLNKGDREEIKNKMMALNQWRKEKQPLEYPSAGSTFKRPKGYFAGALIEQSGLKGTMIGGAAISEKHAGFVINKGGATAKDVRDLIVHIKEIVYEKFQVELHEEVVYIGEYDN